MPSSNLTDHSQCVFATGTGADTWFGWTWRWPVSTPTWQVRAYPEVMAGKSPLIPSFDAGHGLPTPITRQVSFTFDLGKGYIAGPLYYAGVELGTEIVNGAGSAIIKTFSVSVTP